MEKDKMKKIIICITVVAVLLVGVFFWQKTIRCKKTGLTHKNAIKVAIKKLQVDFKKVSFSLKDEAFDNNDKIWILTYHAGDCVVDVIVNRCGASDIGGLTEGCLSFQKK